MLIVVYLSSRIIGTLQQNNFFVYLPMLIDWLIYVDYIHIV
jgi:hypothetical protein